MDAHLPGVKSLWEAHKKTVDGYQEERRAVTQDAINFLRRSTGLELYVNPPPMAPQQSVMFTTLIDVVLMDLRALEDMKSTRWLAPVTANNPPEVKPDPQGMHFLHQGPYSLARSNTAQDCRAIHTTLVSAFAGATSLKEAYGRLARSRTRLRSSQEKIADLLRERTRFPLPLVECEPLKRL